MVYLLLRQHTIEWFDSRQVGNPVSVLADDVTEVSNIESIMFVLQHLNQSMQASHSHSTVRPSTHTRLTALCPGLPRWEGTRKVKPISILLNQETVGGSGISWAICKSAPRSRQTTTPAAHHSYVFYRPDALPAAQPTASKHWRHYPTQT